MEGGGTRRRATLGTVSAGLRESRRGLCVRRSDARWLNPRKKLEAQSCSAMEADDGSGTVAGRREVGKGRERVAAETKEEEEEEEEEGFPSFFLFSSPLAISSSSFSSPSKPVSLFSSSPSSSVPLPP